MRLSDYIWKLLLSGFLGGSWGGGELVCGGTIGQVDWAQVDVV